MRKFVVKAAVVATAASAVGVGLGHNARALDFSAMGETIDFESIQYLGDETAFVENKDGSSSADLYKFTWEAGEDGSFQDFDVSLSNNSNDLLLSLYRVGTVRQESGGNKTFHGVGHSVSGSSNLFAGSLQRGTYYLAVASEGYVPLDANGTEVVFSAGGEGWDKTSTLSAWKWAEGTSASTTGAYELTFATSTGDAANVPEPVTVIGTLLAGGYGIFRKLKSKKQLSSAA